jgi:hypothetical protein
LSKEWTDVVNARGRGAVWLRTQLKVSRMPHPCSLSHYLIGNATIIPDSRIKTYSYVLTPISVLNICFQTLVSGEKKDDNAATILAVHLIYGWDASGPIGYFAPLKSMTKVGPFSGSENSFRGDHKGSISI